jgi:arylsulfatase A-like enzyme
VRRTGLVSVAVVAAAAAIALGIRWWRVPPARVQSASVAAGAANVVLITVDTLRADRLSCYGYTKHKTPHFDQLADEGVLFENAFCDVTWTTPSMTSVMTGRYATVHGVRTGFERLADGATTLAELLHAKGIQTAAIIASFPLASMYGLNQGFDLYDEHFTLPAAPAPEHQSDATDAARATPTPALFGKSRLPLRALLIDRLHLDAYRPDNEVSDRAIRWLREERRGPFFLWVHYLGPHEKPDPTRTALPPLEEERKRYDQDVVFTDQQVGRLLATLDALGLKDTTAVILHADHGESLGEHGVFGHGINVYDPVQHVPLLMRWPAGLPRGRRIPHQVRNLDMFPTILDLMGVKLTVPVDGQSLLPLSTGRDAGDQEEIYVETYLSAVSIFAKPIDESGNVRLGFRRLGIRTPEWKFIINDPIPLVDADDPPAVSDELHKRYYSEELLDLRADPTEAHNVIDSHPDVAEGFRKKIAEYQNRGQAGATQKLQLDETSRERLRSLGYVQ